MDLNLKESWMLSFNDKLDRFIHKETKCQPLSKASSLTRMFKTGSIIFLKSQNESDLSAPNRVTRFGEFLPIVQNFNCL